MQINNGNYQFENLQSDLLLTVKRSIELTEQIITEVQAMVSDFREGMTPELALTFDESLSGIQSLMASMMTMQMIAKRDEAFAVVWNQAYPIWQETEPMFKNSLNELLRAYGHEDYIGLADILEGEFSESLRSWQKFVTKMHDELASK